MKYSDLLVYVMPEVPGCPRVTIEKAIRDTCIDFCVKTDLYKSEPIPVIVVPNVTDYEIDTPNGTEVNHVQHLLRNGRPLSKMTFEDAFMRIEASQPSAPTYYAQVDNNQLVVGPRPQEKETLKLLTSLKPTAASTSIPDTIGLENREALVNGALFRLQMMGGTPWFNQNAGTNKTLYDKGVAAAMRQSRYGYGGAPLTVYPREFI